MPTWPWSPSQAGKLTHRGQATCLSHSAEDISRHRERGQKRGRGGEGEGGATRRSEKQVGLRAGSGSGQENTEACTFAYLPGEIMPGPFAHAWLLGEARVLADRAKGWRNQHAQATPNGWHRHRQGATPNKGALPEDTEAVS